MTRGGLVAARRGHHVPEVTEPSAAGHPVLSAVLAGLLVLGAVAVVLVGIPSPLFDLDRHAVPKELVVHAVALLALPALAWSVQRVRLTIPEYLVLAWVLWSVLSALFAANYWQAFRATGLTISAGVIFWMARRAAGGGRQRMVLAGLCFAAVVAAGTGLAQAYGMEHWVFAESRSPGGTLGNRNFLAHLSVIMLPVLLMLTLRARRTFPLLLGLLGIVASVGLVTLTRSRAAWLAGAVALALLAISFVLARTPGRWGLPRGRPRTVLLALLLGAFGALAIPNALNWRSDSPYRDTLGALVNRQEGSGRGRLIQYRNSLELVRYSPIFGTGPGNWAVEYPRVSKDGDPGFAGWAPIPTNPWPSSDWVAMISERGPVGAGLLLLAGLSMALMATRRLRHEDPEKAHTAATLLAVVAATAVCGAFDAVLLLAPPTLLFFASVGVLLPDAGPMFERQVPRRVTIFLLPLLVGMMTAFAGRSAAQLAAIVTAGDGRDIGQVNQASRLDPGNLRLQLIQAMRLPCNQARAHARQALRLYPHHPSVKRAVARCRAGTFT